ncbi:MAG: DMT family transporter [Bacteroidales bacterium]|nr:DMT family transporter [Bacteroidales bacterium]
MQTKLSNTIIKGCFFGIASAICYGTNPLGALFLYDYGYNVNSVLFYRYFLAVIILGGILLLKRESFKLTAKELGITAILGSLFAISSITFYTSFKHMDAGIACSMLFFYPILVALIMAIFFKEKINAITIVSIILGLIGVFLLYLGDGEIVVSSFGGILIFISSLAYALYIVVVNKSELKLSSYKLTFYVLIFCSIIIVLFSFTTPDNHIQLLTTAKAWGFATMLAILPTVCSLVFMAIAVKNIGSTPTAIMGALEPITAVTIGIIVFDEVITIRILFGIVLILTAVTMIVIGKRK